MGTGKKLYVGHNMRCFPVILKMKELIETGIIGEVQLWDKSAPVPSIWKR